MSIRKTIKRIPGIKTVRNAVKGGDYLGDRKLFYKHYAANENTPEQLEYVLLMELHKLEKGFAAANMRPFGAKKIATIIRLAKTLEDRKLSSSFAYSLAISALRQYVELFEKNSWGDMPQCVEAKDFMGPRLKTVKNLPPYGATNAKAIAELPFSFSDYEKFVSSRHSTRYYSESPVPDREIRKAIALAQKAPSACNRQMCKAYIVRDDKKKKILSEALPGLNLFDENNTNLAVITFDLSFATFIGERSQGWLNAGLFSMNFVNALHVLGIGSCFLQWGETNKKEYEVKKALGIPESERIAVCIAYGHYKDENIALHSARKPIDDVLKIV